MALDITGERLDTLRIRLKELRVGRRWSLRQLEERSGVTYRTILRIERGETQKVGLEHIERLARAFGVPLSTLIPDTDNTGPGTNTTEAEGEAREKMHGMMLDMAEVLNHVERLPEYIHHLRELAEKNPDAARALLAAIVTTNAVTPWPKQRGTTTGAGRSHRRRTDAEAHEDSADGATMLGVVEERAEAGGDSPLMDGGYKP